ncbi:MAG: (d)CMP kinase [Christensenellaceae bacterium]|jgi:cytidylate kinase|nr:(d)CMP kinase [Christensenellaceae bacterium]
MLNIAIDGPAGAGKSTIAKLLAKKYDITYLDTGAMYRGAAYHCILNGVSPNDTNGVERLLPNLDMDVVYEDGVQRVFVSKKDVTPYLRSLDMSIAASDVSKIPSVRVKLVEIQREIAYKRDCVLDGRDIGSYVLPEASIKFYLTAREKTRARRRYLEFLEKNVETTEEKVLRDMQARDKQDTTRDFAPLKVMPDAIVIDSTDLTIEDVIEIMSERIDAVISC